MRVHGSGPSFAATQVLFTAHLPMSPRDRAQQESPLPQEGRGGRSEKTAMCPKTSAHPLQSRGPGAGLRAWYSLSVAASGGKGLGGPWDFRTPREGLDPLEIQLPPTPQCHALNGAAHTVQSPLPPSPTPKGPLEKNARAVSCHGRGGSWRALSCTLTGRASFPNQVNKYTNSGQLSCWPAPAGRN